MQQPAISSTIPFTLFQFILFNQILTTQAIPTKMTNTSRITANNMTTANLNTTMTTAMMTFNMTNITTTRDPLLDYPDYVIDYLVKYGYLIEKRLDKLNEIIKNDTDYTTYSKAEIATALIDFQGFMNIPITGVIDLKTTNKMKQKRCGVPDKIPRDNYHVKAFLTPSGKRKRRALHAFDKNKKSSFNNEVETKFYWDINPMPKFGRRHRDNIWHTMEYALNRWASVANIVFLRGDRIKYSDILIGFWEKKHGDNNDFDGPGGVLGHADVSARTIHFDDEEHWGEKSFEMFWWVHPTNGTDLIQTAIHEIGHVLGLSHDNTSDSVMNPTLQSFAPLSNYYLAQNDIDRVKSSYGRCEPDEITAIFSNKYLDGKTYIIKGPFIYQFDDNKRQVVQSWPRAITLKFFSTTFVDEAFWHTDYFLYFFDGDQYFIFDTTHDSKTQRAGPYKLGDNGREIGFRDLKHHKYIDAALVMNWNGKPTPFIFQDEWVYKYDKVDVAKGWGRTLIPSERAADGWPKKIFDVFPGLPGRIDTAFTWARDGRTYFFKGKYFWIWKPELGRADGIYGSWQWKNVCNVHLCQIAPKPNFYECESWELTKANCYGC